MKCLYLTNLLCITNKKIYENVITKVSIFNYRVFDIVTRQRNFINFMFLYYGFCFKSYSFYVSYVLH